MNDNFKKKFDGIDIVFEFVANKTFNYIIEKTYDSRFIKSYRLIYYIFDKEMEKKQIQEIEKIINRGDIREYEIQVNKIENLYKSERLIEFGTIDCYYDKETITVKIETETNVKRFQYKESDKLGDLLDFMLSEINNEAQKLKSSFKGVKK